MRKHNYTKSIVLTSGLLACMGIANLANAQKADSTFKPSGKVWGQVFADGFYKVHADPYGRGAGQYAGTTNWPQSINGFQLRRMYLGYTYDISPKYTAELLLSAENNLPTQDILGDSKLAPFVKYADIRIKNVFPGADVVIGQQATPAFAKSSEAIWGYRSIEKTIADFHGTPSYDLGVGLQGKFDPKTGNFGYNVLIANGSSAKQAPTTSFKWFYGDVWANFLNKKLFVDLYADYNELAHVTTTSSSKATRSRNMLKLTVGYTTPKLTVGAEGFINTFSNDFATVAVGTSTHDTSSFTATGISLFARGPITKKLGFFARYDAVNPNSSLNASKYASYSIPTAVSSYTSASLSQETFVTFGLDFAADKNVHIMPNVWYNGYDAQAGGDGKDYDLVYRVTVAFTFNK